MADDDTIDPTAHLAARDIVGIVQRSLVELNAYLNRPAEAVDTAAVLQELNRIAFFVTKLPQPVVVGNGASQPEARAN